MQVTYYVGDILTGLILGDLPFEGVTFESLLSGVGTLKGKLQLTDPDVIARGGVDLVQEGKSTLFVDFDGQIVWAGIIWATSYDGASGSLDVAGADFWSYLQRRLVTDDINLTGTTASVIDKIMSYALSDNPPANLSVQYVGSDAATQQCTLVVAGSDRKPVSEVLEGLASANPMFDFRVEGYWVSQNVPGVRYVFGLPRIGLDVDHSGVTYELPGGVVKYTEVRDATALASDLYVRGTSDGSDVREYPFQDSSMYVRYPKYQAAVSIDQSDPSVVQQRGRYIHYARKRMSPKPSVVVRPDQPMIYTYKVGDDALLRIDDPRHPGGEEFDYRLATISCSVDSFEVTLTHWDDPNG